jgi:hypothetical protein
MWCVKWCPHFGHTPHIEKQITKHVVLSYIVSIMFGANYKFVEP